MKILHVIPSLNPADGGPVEGIRQLGAVFVSNGEHQVSVATVDDPKAPFLSDFPLPVYALGPGFTRYGYAPRLLPWLRAHVSDFDVVVVNGLWRYPGVAAWRALHGSDTPYFVFTHGMLDPWFKRRYPFKHLKKWLFWPWTDYRLLRDAQAVLFTCEEEAAQARKSFWLYRCNEVVVNYGTDRPKGDGDTQRRIFAERFPHLRKARICLFMGRIHPKKGCDLLIKAFASTLACDPRWHLVMAGPDVAGWKARLIELANSLGIADRITWADLISGDLKIGALRAAEVFVLPSHQENFGIAVAEALACGTPALISDKVNTWREIKADRAGLAAPDNLAGTCSLFRGWVEMSEADRLAMRESALLCFEKRFHIVPAAASVLRVLSSLATPGDRASAATV